jgi:hypothetical protein
MRQRTSAPSSKGFKVSVVSLSVSGKARGPLGLVIKVAETDYASLIFGLPSNMNRAVSHAVGSSFAESTTHLEPSSRYCEWSRICAYHTSNWEQNTVHYRLYAKDGWFASKVPIDLEEKSLVRLKSSSVPPPRDVPALKRCICATEHIQDAHRTQLFASLLSLSPLSDQPDALLFASDGPGSTPEDPMALVVTLQATDDAKAFCMPSTIVNEEKQHLVL